MVLATLCYIRKDSKTLMVHRIKKENDMHEGKWNGLGGKMEDGETPEECVIREVREETGLELKNPKLKGRILFPNNLQKGIDWHVYVFIAEDFDGELIAESPEGELEWIDNEKLLDLNIWPSDKIFIPWLDRNDFFSVKFIYDKNGLKDHVVVFH